MYAALNPKLRAALEAVRLRFPGDIDPYEALSSAASERERETDHPPIHRLHLAFATMALAAARPGGVSDRLTPVGVELVREDIESRAQAGEFVLNDLERAAGAPLKERWAQVWRADRGRGESILHPDLYKIEDSWCHTDLRRVGGEIASRIETSFIVEDATRDLDTLARAVLPQNWKVCNDFFCELIRREDRDLGCPGATGGPLRASDSHWRGMYEERVGECPGWFPDTYLAFTWDRSPNQIILRYELAPRRDDRPALKIDQGYIQIDQAGATYTVSTLKYLLFDDDEIPSGGQYLGQAACHLGWLDCSINQFTDCATKLNKDASPPAEPVTSTTGSNGSAKPTGHPRRGGMDAGLQQVLDRCEIHLLESAKEADARSRRAAREFRQGTYGLDDFVADCAAQAVSVVRDGARSAQGQLDLAREWWQVARVLTRRRGTGMDDD